MRSILQRRSALLDVGDGKFANKLASWSVWFDTNEGFGAPLTNTSGTSQELNVYNAPGKAADSALLNVTSLAQVRLDATTAVTAVTAQV